MKNLITYRAIFNIWVIIVGIVSIYCAINKVDAPISDLSKLSVIIATIHMAAFAIIEKLDELK